MYKIDYFDNQDNIILTKNFNTAEELFIASLGLKIDTLIEVEATIATASAFGTPVLTTSIDDLLLEYNMEAFTVNSDLKQALQEYFPDINVDLYLDIKNELPKYVKANLKSLNEKPGDSLKLTAFQYLEFGEGLAKEVYSVDGSPCGIDYDIHVFATNLDVNMLLLSLCSSTTPKKENRFNFRNISELERYVLSFYKKETEDEIPNIIFLRSYTQFPVGEFL